MRSRFVKNYLDEKPVDNVNKMAEFADDYVVTVKRSKHKTGNSFVSGSCLGCKFGFRPNSSPK